ncbi:MAG: DUF4234 domain-containing protein [Bacilli bacterium]|nr:DUF4234 domain-containing protein [Bacilli bacterium]
MAKYCQNCGKEVEDNAVFCGNCGASQNGAQPVAQAAAPTGPAPKVPNRNIVTSIILSLVTCGLYGIYWMITLQDDSNLVCDENTTSGVTVFLLTLVTCGIYGWFWYYKMGQRLFQAGQKYGKQISDNSIIYILLGVFGLGIVNYCLMQSDLNKFSDQ